MTGDITVAAVDDHPIILDSLTGWLAGDGDIRVVATAATVAALLAGRGRAAAVVLLDLELGDGTTVAGKALYGAAGALIGLRSQLAQTEGQVAALEQRYGPNYPPLQQAQAQLESLKKSGEDIRQKVLAGAAAVVSWDARKSGRVGSPVAVPAWKATSALGLAASAGLTWMRPA